MTHSVFTIVASIVPGRVAQLEEALRNHPVDFRHLKQLHFASFVIFDRDTPDAILVFENAIDGASDPYLAELMDRSGAAIEEIYKNCLGYPAGRDNKRAKLDYLKSHLRKPDLYHVGTAFRTVGSIKGDRELRSKLDAYLQTLMDTADDEFVVKPSASTLWQRLQRKFPVWRHRQPRLLELIKDFAIMLSPLLVASPIIWYLWDRHWALLGFMATIYSIKALWLLMLVGWWPLAGDYKRVGFIALAAAFGTFLGLWPWYPDLPLVVSALVLGPVLAAVLARLLPTRRARRTAGNWPIVPLALLAAAITWLPVWTVRVITHWIALGIERRIGIGLPAWLDIIGTAVVAIVFFALAFVWLTFVSALPGKTGRLLKFRYDLLLIGGGTGALLFWEAVMMWQTRWPAAIWLAFLSLAGLIGLWDIALPTPNVQVGPLDRVKLKAIEEQEDKDIQNHMSVMVRIMRPRRWRALLLILFLRLLNRGFYRTILPTGYKSTLFGIPTVHFAHWTVLDKTRHMFLSNYDQSWSLYLDDFGAALTTGLQKIWGQSEGNPGVTDLAKFKQFVRTVMVPHQVWYSAYPGLTSEQIANNRKIRQGMLNTHLYEEECAELLRRLNRIEPS